MATTKQGKNFSKLVRTFPVNLIFLAAKIDFATLDLAYNESLHALLHRSTENVFFYLSLVVDFLAQIFREMEPSSGLRWKFTFTFNISITFITFLDSQWFLVRSLMVFIYFFSRFKLKGNCIIFHFHFLPKFLSMFHFFFVYLLLHKNVSWEEQKIDMKCSLLSCWWRFNATQCEIIIKSFSNRL